MYISQPATVAALHECRASDQPRRQRCPLRGTHAGVSRAHNVFAGIGGSAGGHGAQCQASQHQKVGKHFVDLAKLMNLQALAQ